MFNLALANPVTYKVKSSNLTLDNLFLLISIV